MMKKQFCLALLLWAAGLPCVAQTTGRTKFEPGKEWLDTSERPINAHGGNILLYNGVYYWYGEHRPYTGGSTCAGIQVYTSGNLLDWTSGGIVLPVSTRSGDDIESGCIMERPKVVYNKRTGKFVMLFHLELKGKGYAATRVGFAVSDTPTGPFRFIRSLRPNAGKWPADFSRADIKKAKTLRTEDYKEWWTPEWRQAVNEGLFVNRDIKGGFMSRDMTVYIDDDGTAYHIFSSEENLTLHVAELTPDYLDYTGHYTRIVPGGLNEAPVVFKHNGTYWLIASGCTGWAPNKARMFSAPSLNGPWKQHESPFTGPDAEKTFHGQGTSWIQLPEPDGRMVFMADKWNPKHLMISQHIWLPVEFGADGTPTIPWRDEWMPKGK